MESTEIYDCLLLFPQIGVCGLNCKHCWVTDNLKKHKPFEEVKRMIDGMAKTLQEPAITKKALVYFLDELTLHPQATEILAYCRECNVLPQPTLVTNGQGIAARDNWREILSELKKCDLNGFLMTINGDEEYHDWFTGRKGSFQRTIEATRRANEYDLWVMWNMYLTNENVDQVVESARMKGDDRIRISVPINTKRWKEWSHIHADIDVFSRIPEDCRQYVRGDYRSESEWIDLILNEGINSLEEKPEDSKKKHNYKSLIEYHGIFYKPEICPGYEVGPVSYDNLREAFLSDKVPLGISMDKGMNLHDLAAKHGNPNCRKAFSLAGLEYKWSYDERLELLKNENDAKHDYR